MLIEELKKRSTLKLSVLPHGNIGRKENPPCFEFLVIFDYLPHGKEEREGYLKTA